MTNLLTNNSSLLQVIKNNNISLEFLKSSLKDDNYHTDNFNYDNLLWKFSCFENYLHLLQKSKKELLKIRVVGENTISKLEKFLAIYNCEIGMFENLTTCQINSILNKQISICDLTKQETYLSLVLLKCMVNYTPNDTDLGKEIRKIFNTIK
jgi:hypothetical protein